jgi:hypothetical protein
MLFRPDSDFRAAMTCGMGRDDKKRPHQQCIERVSMLAYFLKGARHRNRATHALLRNGRHLKAVSADFA